jgi:cysteine desulfurase
VAGIAALGLASERVLDELPEEAVRLNNLRDRMEERILSAVTGARVNGGGSERLPNTSNIAFKGVEGEAVLFGLDEHGIATSSASACAAEETDPSYVLTEMGLSMMEAMGSIRFSLGKYSTDDHVDTLLDVLPGVVKLLRKLMPGQDS